MTTTHLTDRQFWLDYWEQKSGLVFKVSDQYPFIKDLSSLIAKYSITSMLEIGGFPGYFSVWAQKQRGVKSTLFDFVVHKKILHDLEKANGMPVGSIETIEADLFSYPPRPQYDLVVSNGLIEHFTDTADLIGRHVAFVRPGGRLFLTLPNFKGLNGWFQRRFDPENYAKHYIDCMDPDFLRETCASLGLHDIDVHYEGRFMLWLENEEQQPAWVKAFLKATWLPSKVFFKVVPLESRQFSPYLVISARV